MFRIDTFKREKIENSFSDQAKMMMKKRYMLDDEDVVDLFARVAWNIALVDKNLYNLNNEK